MHNAKLSIMFNKLYNVYNYCTTVGVCVVGGWLKWPHLAQIESVVGGGYSLT